MNNKKSLGFNGMHILAGSLFLLIYSACNNSAKVNNAPPANAPKVEQKVSKIQLLLGNGTHLFRLVDLGIDSKTVLNSEKKVPDENDSDDISYTMPLDTLHPDSVNEAIDSVSYFTLTYYFDKGKLNEVDEDVFLENDSVAANFLARLTDYLSSKYGDYASQNDSRVWSVNHKGKKEWITLSDQSEEYDNGKLQLVFYSEDY